jgi:hypothetical protein
VQGVISHTLRVMKTDPSSLTHAMTSSKSIDARAYCRSMLTVSGLYAGFIRALISMHCIDFYQRRLAARLQGF